MKNAAKDAAIIPTLFFFANDVISQVVSTFILAAVAKIRYNWRSCCVLDESHSSTSLMSVILVMHGATIEAISPLPQATQLSEMVPVTSTVFPSNRSIST